MSLIRTVQYACMIYEWRDVTRLEIRREKGKKMTMTTGGYPLTLDSYSAVFFNNNY